MGYVVTEVTLASSTTAHHQCSLYRPVALNKESTLVLRLNLYTAFGGPNILYDPGSSLVVVPLTGINVKQDFSHNCGRVCTITEGFSRVPVPLVGTVV